MLLTGLVGANGSVALNSNTYTTRFPSWGRVFTFALAAVNAEDYH